MTAESVDISGLSSDQRVALMERLWRSLAGDPRTVEPPAWHDVEIDARRQEWMDRERLAEDWPKVREELRRDLR
jgi:hypothetical protein